MEQIQNTPNGTTPLHPLSPNYSGFLVGQDSQHSIVLNGKSFFLFFSLVAVGRTSPGNVSLSPGLRGPGLGGDLILKRFLTLTLPDLLMVFVEEVVTQRGDTMRRAAAAPAAAPAAPAAAAPAAPAPAPAAGLFPLEPGLACTYRALNSAQSQRVAAPALSSFFTYSWEQLQW
ncbi:hypothetical protein INR49_014766 [Caranx melampygus]|nr:hypothetical protein INR49_014766 [Caranx melampygus]